MTDHLPGGWPWFPSILSHRMPPPPITWDIMVGSVGMARTPDGAAARTTFLTIRLTAAGAQAVHEARGSLSVSAYLRGLIAADVAARKRKVERS